MPFRDPIVAGDQLVRNRIRSPNYVTGVAGWTINRDGSAEFNNVVVRGTVIAADFRSNNYVANTTGFDLNGITGLINLNGAVTIAGAADLKVDGGAGNGMIELKPSGFGSFNALMNFFTRAANETSPAYIETYNPNPAQGLAFEMSSPVTNSAGQSLITMFAGDGSTPGSAGMILNLRGPTKPDGSNGRFVFNGGSIANSFMSTSTTGTGGAANVNVAATVGYAALPGTQATSFNLACPSSGALNLAFYAQVGAVAATAIGDFIVICPQVANVTQGTTPFAATDVLSGAWTATAAGAAGGTLSIGRTFTASNLGLPGDVLTVTLMAKVSAANHFNIARTSLQAVPSF